MSLFAELRRRNVIRVAGLYIVGAWLLVQVAETLLPIFHTPDWVLQVLVVLLALGLLPALVFSWVFELTPQGLRRERAGEPAPHAVDPTARKLDIAVLVALFVIGALMLWAERGAERGSESISRVPASDSSLPGREIDSDPLSAPLSAPRSIAVLAFDDLSAEGDQAYFAEGVSEELLNLLARIDGLKVAARTSSFKFRDGAADIGEIGRALNVDTVLEGSVRKAGDQVRVTAQLIKVSDGFHLWSQSYDRRLENIFAVQDEIAAAIVHALKLELDIDSATAGRTEDTAAYDHYLRGRDLARAPTRSGLLRAIEQYQQAVALDPQFAAAYAGIADAWVWLEDYGGVKSTESFPRAEQAARRALAIDPGSAEAHAAMAFVLDRYHEDLEGARDAFERTLEINPNYVTAYNLYGDTLESLGDYERMLAVHRKAVELDPLSVFLRTRLASKLITLRRFDEARSILDQVFTEFPDNDFAHEESGNLAQAQGELAAAFRHYRRLHEARPGDPFAAAQMAVLAINFEDYPLAEAWVAACRERGADNRWELYARTRLAFARGDWDGLAVLADLHGGHRGTYLRAVAAARRSQWPEARRDLLEAIDLAGPEQARVVPSIELAWVEQQQDLDGWQARLPAPRQTLEALISSGLSELNFYDAVEYQMARLEAVAGRREQALQSLRDHARRGVLDPAFLRHDPVFAAWKDDPEFMALVDDMRAHAAAERARLEGASLLP